MKKLILCTLTSLLVGCSSPTEAPPTTATPAPITALSETPAAPSLEDRILAEASSWKTVEDIWARVHPQCKAALSGEKELQTKKALAGILVLSRGGPAKVELYSATPNPAYTFPVPPTHSIKSEDGIPMYFISSPGEEEWHVVLTVRTAAGQKADAEYRLEDSQVKEVAAKILDELTQEERTFLKTTLREKGKIAAIKELRKMSTHSLKVQKLVIESL